MRSFKLTLLLLLLGPSLSAQISYSGFIDSIKIELVAKVDYEQECSGIYMYKNINTPIALRGKLINKDLVLYEKNDKGKTSAVITITDFNKNSQTLNGSWKSLITKKERHLQLSKTTSIDHTKEVEWKDKELLQVTSLKNYYFRIILAKSKDSSEPRVSGLKIFNKKTDLVVQQIELDCSSMGFNSVSANDYNFDGITDFSVFESSYAGANTSSIYYLFDPKSATFYDSGFSGISLEFYPQNKTIIENNQCCAGSQLSTTIYKLVKGEMVIVSRHCYIWNDKKKKHVERDIRYCE